MNGIILKREMLAVGRILMTSRKYFLLNRKPVEQVQLEFCSVFEKQANRKNLKEQDSN